MKEGDSKTGEPEKDPKMDGPPEDFDFHAKMEE